MKKGLVHIYTGPGKGKTTAALGLALRAAGAGYSVYIYQFMKGRPCAEVSALKKIKNIKLERCGRGSFIKGRPAEADIGNAKKGLSIAKAAIASGRYDVVILDEINIALRLGLIGIKETIELIRNKPASVELVLTGRGANPRLISQADYVTWFDKVKHPFDRGISARRGIEY